MINSLHIKLTRVRCIIAGLRPAFTNFADKLNDLLGQACLIAFGPDPEEDEEGCRAWCRRANITTAIIMAPFMVFFIVRVLQGVLCSR